MIWCILCDMKGTSRLQTIAYCLFPLLAYYVVYEIAASVLLLGVQAAAASGNAQAAVWISSHAADVSALITALAMTAGFLAIHKIAAREAPFVLRISCRMEEAAAALLLALSASIGLNLFLSLSGAMAADAGASNAGGQTAGVSLPLGLVVYGVLSPLIEEAVFRGVTFGRIYRASRMKYAAAALLSSFLFGVYHGNIVQGLYAFCMGMIFCGILKLTGSLAACAAAHGAVNAAALILSQSGLYDPLCTEAWAAAFLGIAVCCGIYLLYVTKTG